MSNMSSLEEYIFWDNGNGCGHDFFGWVFTNETKIFSLFLVSFYMFLFFLVLGFSLDVWCQPVFESPAATVMCGDVEVEISDVA